MERREPSKTEIKPSVITKMVDLAAGSVPCEVTIEDRYDYYLYYNKGWLVSF